jgi:flagellar basal body-associated protein FliL
MRERPATARDEGQASVELLGALPVLIIVCGVAWAAALAGQAWWLAGSAARAAARADAIGQDPTAAARASLPSRLQTGVSVADVGGGSGVKVTIRLPRALGIALGSASATAQMREQR